jgi:DNA polymerase III alpha subunit
MPDDKHKPLQDILLGNSDEFKRSGFKEHHTYSMKSVEQMYEDVKKMSPYISDEQFLDMCHTTIEILDKTYDLKMKFKPELPKIVYSENIVNIDPIWEEKFLEVKEIIRPISPLMLDLFEIAEQDIALKTSLKVIIKNGKMDFSNPAYVNRLADEIKIIQRNGVIQLLDYFLLLEDVTYFVVSIGKYRGFGRGSGAGSLLAYTLDITDCDPLIYTLLFERFLTKERIGKFLIDHPEYPLDGLDPLDI